MSQFRGEYGSLLRRVDRFWFDNGAKLVTSLSSPSSRGQASASLSLSMRFVPWISLIRVSIHWLVSLCSWLIALFESKLQFWLKKLRFFCFLSFHCRVFEIVWLVTAVELWDWFLIAMCYWLVDYVCDDCIDESIFALEFHFHLMLVCWCVLLLSMGNWYVCDVSFSVWILEWKTKLRKDCWRYTCLLFMKPWFWFGGIFDTHLSTQENGFKW